MTDLLSTKIDITPTDLLPMFGYASRTGSALGVSAPIEVNLVQLISPDATITLLAVDALYGGQVGSLVAKRLQAGAGSVLALGSHTHFAPGVDTGIPALGPTDAQFVSSIVDATCESIGAGQSHEAVQVSVGLGSASRLFINRRAPSRRWLRRAARVGEVMTAPNPVGPKDEAIRVFVLSSQDVVRGVIWGVGCHPVCSPDPAQISACFPGRVRDAIRDELGIADLPVLFAQGFSADVRPNAISSKLPRRPRQLAQVMLAGRLRFVPQSESDYTKWCDELAGHVVGALRDAIGGSTAKVEVEHRIATRESDTWDRDIAMHQINLGNGVGILTVNAEVASERQADLGRIGTHVLPASCVDEVIGYWPTDRMRSEGGYEGNTSQCFFPTVDWDAFGGPDRVWHSLIDELCWTRH